MTNWFYFVNLFLKIKKKEMRPVTRNKGGRPKKTESEKSIAHMMRVKRKKDKETGKHIDDVLVNLIYDEVATPRDRLAAIRLFKEYTMSKTSEQNINVSKQVGPVIGLPPLKEDPALKVVK